MTSQQISELLSAYLDGEVDDRERRTAERLIHQDSQARRLYEELRRNRDLVASLPHHAAPPGIFSDLQGHVERSALLDEPHSVADARTFRTFKRIVPLVAAASLAFAALFGWWYFENSFPPAQKLAQSRQAAESDVLTGTAGANNVPDRSRPATTIDEKLASNMPIAALRTHAFSAEPVRLQIAVNDEAEQVVLAEKLSKRLSAAHLVDLSQAPSGPAVVSEVHSRGFFLRGQPGKNFEKPKEEQLLVRASGEQIAQVFAELPAAHAGEAIELQAGPLKVQGRARSEEFLEVLTAPEIDRVADKAERPEADNLARRARKDGNTLGRSADQKFLDDLLRGVGIDPALLTRRTQPPAESGADHPTNEPGHLVARRESTVRSRAAQDSSEALAEAEARPTAAAGKLAGGRDADNSTSSVVEGPQSRFVTFVIEIRPTEATRSSAPRPVPPNRISPSSNPANKPAGRSGTR